MLEVLMKRQAQPHPVHAVESNNQAPQFGKLAFAAQERRNSLIEAASDSSASLESKKKSSFSQYKFGKSAEPREKQQVQTNKQQASQPP